MIRVATNGTVSTVLKAERPWSPNGVAVRDGAVYVLEYKQLPNVPGKSEEWQPRVRKLASDGQVTTLATLTSEPSKSEQK